MCNDTSLLGILSIVKRIMLLIQITVPIFLIIYATIQFITLVKYPDKKMEQKRL